MSDDNPYAAPADSDAVDGEANAAPLHDARNVMLGAFLGGVFGGTWMIYENDRANGGTGSQVLLTGLAATAALAVLVFVLPEGVPGFVFTIAAVFGCRAWMETTQGPWVTERLLDGVPRHSRWRAAGFGLLMLIPTLIVTLLVGAPILFLLAV